MRYARTLVAMLAATGAVTMTGAPRFESLERAASTFFVTGPTDQPAADLDPAAVSAPIRSSLAAWAAPQSDGPSPEHPAATPPAEQSRGPLLCALYLSFVTLQGLDAHSTLRAIDRGAVEGNPLVAPFTDHPPAFVAVKMGTSAGILYLTERVRKRSRVAAIVMMAAFNSAYATVVAHNYRVASRLGR